MSEAAPARSRPDPSLPRSSRATPGLLLTALFPAALWGINNVAIAVAARHLPVATFNASRSALSVLCLLLWLQVQKGLAPASLSRRTVGRGLLVGGVGLGIFQILLVLSINVNGAAISAVLSTLSQLIAVAYERRSAGGPPHARTGAAGAIGLREITGSLAALAGVCVIFLPEITAVQGWNPLGLVYGLAAPVCWAIFTIGSRPLLAAAGPLLSTGLALAGATLVLTPFSFIEWRAGLIPPLAGLPAGAWFAFAVSVAVGAVLSNVVWLRVLQAVGPARALLATYMLPVVTMVLSVVLLGDAIDAYEAVGSLLVVLGVAWVRPPR